MAKVKKEDPSPETTAPAEPEPFAFSLRQLDVTLVRLGLVHDDEVIEQADRADFRKMWNKAELLAWKIGGECVRRGWEALSIPFDDFYAYMFAQYPVAPYKLSQEKVRRVTVAIHRVYLKIDPTLNIYGDSPKQLSEVQKRDAAIIDMRINQRIAVADVIIHIKNNFPPELHVGRERISQIAPTRKNKRKPKPKVSKKLAR